MSSSPLESALGAARRDGVPLNGAVSAQRAPDASRAPDPARVGVASTSGQAGRNLEDRNREQIYEVAKRLDIPGRSKMGKWDLIEAIRKRR